MNILIALLIAVGTLAACTSQPPVIAATADSGQYQRSTIPTAVNTEVNRLASPALNVDVYKRDLARHIEQRNADRIFPGQPQALLRSVVVLNYTVDEGGQLLHIEVVRSNQDQETEATALASLRRAAPFPKPTPHLLRHGKLQVSETWLFNNDGRFQLRTIALPQMSEWQPPQ